jgi:putative transcriptional regulator
MPKGLKKIKIYPELHEALEDALCFEAGEKVDLRVTELPAPPRALRPREIREIRQSLNASQTRFARFLNVSANTVESWEQGTRQPQHATLKLLSIAKKRPKVLLES